MMHAPRKVTHLLTVAALAGVSGGGCARRSAVANQAASPEATRSAQLRVQNSNWSDVRVYLARGPMVLRLGIVTSGQTVVFDIPPDFLGRSGDVTLVASPIGSSDVYSTPLIWVAPGEMLEFRVQNILDHSHLIAPL